MMRQRLAVAAVLAAAALTAPQPVRASHLSEPAQGRVSQITAPSAFHDWGAVRGRAHYFAYLYDANGKQIWRVRAPHSKHRWTHLAACTSYYSNATAYDDGHESGRSRWVAFKTTGTCTPSSPKPSPDPDPDPDPGSGTLVLADGFNGPAGAAPNPATWRLRTQEPGGELECYTQRAENVAQDGNGHLRIVARHDDACPSSRTWTSGKADTRGLKTWQYGRVEARIKLGSAIGSWPAFWTVGDPGTWPEAGEIDMLEYPQPDTARQMRAHQAMHANTTSSTTADCGWHSHDETASTPWHSDWHVYGMDWKRDRVEFLIDGRVVWSQTPLTMPGTCVWQFNRPHGLILNVAVGGWGGTPDTSQFPSEMLVDWVQVRQGSGGSTPPPEPSPGPPPSSGGEHVVVAAGDFASSGTDPEAIAVKNTMTAANPEYLLGLGDYNYSGDIDGILPGYDRIFGPNPGGLFGITRPTAGPTHDVTSCLDTRYEEYFGRPAMQGYSFNVGQWHVVQMPSAAFRYGCDTGGLTAWLKNDLAANASRCTLAYWHEPFWSSESSGHSRTTAVRPWVQALYDDNAEIVLSGHQHNYERFAEQNPSDQADPGRGIRQFVSGTGGVGAYSFEGGAAVNSQARNANTFGALRLTLRDGAYDWRFLPAAGGTFTDSGTGACH
jgi:beta-glucanase (GH16 family)